MAADHASTTGTAAALSRPTRTVSMRRSRRDTSTGGQRPDGPAAGHRTPSDAGSLSSAVGQLQRANENAPANGRLSTGNRAPTQEGAPANHLPPPTLVDLAWVGAIAALKAAIVALAADAWANSDQPKFSGKAMKVRALGYTASLFVVPLAWRLRGHDRPYPRGLDLLVTLPLLADAGGNASGIYQRAHVDDAIHFANGALLTGVVGALVTARTRTAVEAASYAMAIGTAAGAGWEIFEWLGLKLGAKGMDLTYDDTMEDLIETASGALLGGLITLLRHPGHLRRVPGLRSDPLVRWRG